MDKNLARTLEEITTEAKVIYNRMEKDYYKLGELLLEAKKQVPHGQWMKYLEENFPAFGRRQANRYMQIVREDKTLPEVTSRSSPMLPNWTRESNLELHSDVKEHSVPEAPRRERTPIPETPLAHPMGIMRIIAEQQKFCYFLSVDSKVEITKYSDDQRNALADRTLETIKFLQEYLVDLRPESSLKLIGGN
jgi:hypothetical protein